MKKLLALIALVGLTGAGYIRLYAGGPKNVMEAAKQNGMTEAYDAVDKTGLMGHATGESSMGAGMQPFTFFAPVNGSFADTALAQLKPAPSEDSDKDDPQEEKREALELRIKELVIPAEDLKSLEAGKTLSSVGETSIEIIEEDGKKKLKVGKSKVTIVGGPFSSGNGTVWSIASLPQR